MNVKTWCRNRSDIFYDVSTQELDPEPEKTENDNECAPAIQVDNMHDNIQDNEENIHLHSSLISLNK